MEDESGLELSLGLSFGGSSSKFKLKDVSSYSKGNEGSGNRIMGSNAAISDESFKNFLKSDLENQEPKGKQKSELITQLQENFFTDLVKCPASFLDCSNDEQNNLAPLSRYQEQLTSCTRTVETEKEKSGSHKRKLPFEEINFQNKHEKLVDYVELQGAKKSSRSPFLKNSHVSNMMEDGSTGENEDVAESESEDPQPWLVSQGEENLKSSDSVKLNGKGVLSESSDFGFQGLREPFLSGKASNSDYQKPEFRNSLPLQPLKILNNPCPPPTTVPSTISGPTAAGFPSTCSMQLLPIAKEEQAVAPTANSNHMQLAFGYPSAHLPTLETGSSWAFNSQPLLVSSFTSREQSNEVQIQEHFEDGVKTSQGPAPHNIIAAFAPDLAIGSTKYVGEASVEQGQGKSRTNPTQANAALNKASTEALSHGPAIRPGIAPNLRFGGCGSYPDLPWVSTTGQGPNGRTISGVTYKYSQNQIKIVCACHGTHMSPEEFIQHASAEVLNSENNPNLASFPTSNTTNSAQS